MLDSVKERIAQYGIIADALRFIRRTDRGKPNGVASLDNDGKILPEQLPDVALVETDPTIFAWAKKPEKPTYTADEVGADALGTAATLIDIHNVNTEAHNDIRVLLAEVVSKLNAFLDVDDTKTDQLSELLKLISENATDIKSITSDKVNYTDIIDNLNTNLNNKALSAAQGVILKQAYDAIAADYVKTATIAALEERINALEDALGGFKIRGAKSAPIDADENTLTFVDLRGEVN